MSLSNYKYVSDAGTTYQVSLPDDFASALSEILAVGTEPYLDAAISPRYAIYRTLSGVTRSAIITTDTLFGTLPTSLTVDGVSYSLVSAFGQSIPPIGSPLLFSPQGPQGAPGAHWSPEVASLTNYTSQNFSSSSRDNVGTLNIVGGAFLIWCKMIAVLDAGTPGFIIIEMWSDARATILDSTAIKVAAIGEIQCLSLLSLAAPNTTADTLHLWITCPSQDVTINELVLLAEKIA